MITDLHDTIGWKNVDLDDWVWSHDSAGRRFKKFKCFCRGCGKPSYKTRAKIKSSIRGCSKCSRKGFYQYTDEPDQAAINQAWNQHKQNAKTRGLDQLLTKEMWMEIIKQPCYYCGKTYSRVLGNSFVCNGVDRLNSNIGYILSNSVPSCTNCNLAKQSLDSDEFIEMCRRIAEKHPS